MDAVSYANSAKQAQRIKKFINDPDSTSGIVTVPKVIASGETITIPTGRVAVLPNVQIDGVLNVENGGEVFIPSGSILSTVVEKVTSTDNAIVRFDGTTGLVQNSRVIIDDNGNVVMPVGSRITGDFSNATLSNRTMFQTSTSNSSTVISCIPNGTATSAYFTAHNTSDTTNYSICSINCTPTAAKVSSISAGTAPNIPLNFFVSGIDRATLDTNGNFLLLAGTGALGYGTGAGGTVTQLTSKSTAVTLNKPCGQIIVNNSALAAGASVGFMLYNSLLTGNDNVKVIVGASGAAGAYQADCIYCINGASHITIKNLDSTSRTDAVAINFTIIKGASS